MQYSRRIIDDVLDELFPSLPAILLDGPKAVGKTTTAIHRAKNVKQLDNPAQKLRADLEPTWVVTGTKPILLDEWHHVPHVWDSVKRAIDDDYSGGQFILTGSLPTRGTHSGAGRITSFRMRPLSFAERHPSLGTIGFRDFLAGSALIEGECKVTVDDYLSEMTQSGFPAIRKLSGRALRLALDGYIERIVDTDVPFMGLNIRKPKSLKNWLTAYAAATGTTASWEKIRDTANSGYDQVPARATVTSYTDALTRLRILDELQPWSPSKNQITRAGLASKHYLADPALAIRLMNFDSESLSTALGYGSQHYGEPLVGRLFEAFVVMSVQTYAQGSFAKVMHFRDSAGRHEVDMIIQREDGKILAVEVKYGSLIADRDCRHLKWLKDHIGDELIDSAIIYPGKYAYRKDGIAVIPFGMLGA